MLAKQRYTKILELLDKDGIVHTAELVKLMGVSSETIRKDLEYLDSQGRLSRVHGGAVPCGFRKTSGYSGGIHFPSDPQLPEPGAKSCHHIKGSRPGKRRTGDCPGLRKHQPDDGACIKGTVPQPYRCDQLHPERPDAG
ncbi:MAG: DeoR family transcriptional regulator [Enterocloster bolteae]